MAEDKKDPFDGEYIGNIFGWKFSMVGLALILLLSALMLYRHWKLGVPFGFELESQEQVEINEVPLDTIN
jgi:predicted MFS family arabinose efflux permease